MPSKTGSDQTSEAPEVLILHQDVAEFGINDAPPWYIVVFAALQQVMCNIGSNISAAYIIYQSICPGNNQILQAELISTTFFMGGLVTMLQVLVGVRLPIVYGSAFSFFPVIVAMKNIPKWRCPQTSISHNGTHLTPVNDTLAADLIEPWEPQLLEISGSLAAASCLQIFLGVTGLIGALLRFIGPITITTLITLIGLTLYHVAIDGASAQWGIAVLCGVLYIIFGLVLRNVHIPLPSYNREKGWHKKRYPFFKLFPHLSALCVAWLLCYILTVTDVFTSDPDDPEYQARTDAKIGVISKADWWFIPYPGRYGTPTFGVGTFVGMSGALLISLIDTIGDYSATARACGVPVPPQHAVNRGILVEGLGGLLSGLVGQCHPTTSYSSTPGHIQISGVSSRVVWLTYGLFMMGLGLCGKIGATLSIVPAPILSGLVLMALGMVAGIGLSHAKHIPPSSRNLLILGLSVVMGLVGPDIIRRQPDIIHTGVPKLDQALGVMLSTGIFVGGGLSLLLDNLIPASPGERAMDFTAEGLTNEDTMENISSDLDVYNIPLVGKLIRDWSLCTFVPFLPTYSGMEACRGRRKSKATSTQIKDEPSSEENDITLVVDPLLGTDGHKLNE